MGAGGGLLLADTCGTCNRYGVWLPYTAENKTIAHAFWPFVLSMCYLRSGAKTTSDLHTILEDAGAKSQQITYRAGSHTACPVLMTKF
jgi:hypothetical protein